MLLEVNKLKLTFHDRAVPTCVVNDISFNVTEGEILGIVGESGSGKSQTALAIAGLLSRKDLEKSGEIFFDGKSLLYLQRSELRKIQGKEIGFIFQEPQSALNPTMKIGKQVEESLRIHFDMTKDERKAKAIEYLKNVELPDAERVYNSFPHELSGGMRQRAMIAAAMISEPKLLICDEITTALDVTIQAEIIELLKRINKKRGVTILFISHDLSLIKSLCERVIVMKKGKIVEEGLSKDIFNNPREEYTKNLINSIPKI